MEAQLNLQPTNNHKFFNVHLNLGYKNLIIGKLDFTGEGAFRTKRKFKHLHHATQSLGLNYELLFNDEFHFKWIVIDYLGKELITTREFFKNFSFDRHYPGYEKQRLLRLDLFGRKEALQYERKQRVQFVQQDLFYV